MSLDHFSLVSGGDGFTGHQDMFENHRFAMLDRIVNEVDHVGRLHFMTRDILVVNSPSAVHEVLVSKSKAYEKSPLIRTALYPLVGEGLFTAGGPLWRRQRRLMAPMFHPAKIDVLADIMVECAEHDCRTFADGARIDMAHETTRIAMQVAGRTLFGIDTTQEAAELSDALTVALDSVNLAAQSLPIILQVELRMLLLERAGDAGRFERFVDELGKRLDPPILWPTSKNRGLKRAIALLDDLVQRMIDERRRDARVQNDLLSHLIRARDEADGSGMSDKQMRDEILTLFVAGHETTANGLAWAMYSLARDPALYARARACVDALSGRTPTLADVERLSFLTCVFREALRLYPPVYIFGRMSIEDTTVAGQAVPKYTVVLISPWTLQRRPDLWPDPLRFDPDRFAAANAKKLTPDAFIPFSDGPRICIGEHFAELEAPLVLAALLQRADYHLMNDAPIVPEPSATLRPAGGVPMRVSLRNG
jgi:cytochrome P450